MVGTTLGAPDGDQPMQPSGSDEFAAAPAVAPAGEAPSQPHREAVSAHTAEGHPAVTNLFTGMPPLLMLGLGVVVGAAISFALGVVFWSVFA